MAMRLYKKEEIIAVATKFGLTHIHTTEHHLVFQDKNGEPFSAPCPEEGCADYLYDIFIAKINKSDEKIAGTIRRYEVSEEL